MGRAGMVDLQVLSRASAAAEPLLLVLKLDGRLYGFEEVALRLKDGLDRLYPLGRRFCGRRVADEGAILRTARRTASAATVARRGVPRVCRLDDEFDRLAGFSHFELVVQ